MSEKPPVLRLGTLHRDDNKYGEERFDSPYSPPRESTRDSDGDPLRKAIYRRNPGNLISTRTTVRLVLDCSTGDWFALSESADQVFEATTDEWGSVHDVIARIWRPTSFRFDEELTFAERILTLLTDEGLVQRKPAAE